MEQNFKGFQNFKELDLFIQNSLDKYFYVEPWKKLYERTGKIHRDIISDKSTIPDLIIYNKTFNKSDCFLESNEKTYIKYPRMRFILRPKYKKEYNPTVTYGKNDEVYFYMKQQLSENINNLNISLNNEFKDEKQNDLNEQKTFLKQKGSLFDFKKLDQNENILNEKNNNINHPNNLEDEDDEEEPEWANDNVEDYINTKIEFKAIPKSIEDKMTKDLGMVKEDMNKIELAKFEKNNIDIDSFFKNNNDNYLNEIQISTKNNNNNILQEINDFMRNESNEGSELKIESDIDNNIDTHIDSNIDNDSSNELYINNEMKENSNKHYNIFDTENKFNDIFLENQKPNTLNNIQQRNNNYNNDFSNKKYSRFFNCNTSINIKNDSIKEINRAKEYEEEQIKKLIIMQQQKANQQYIQMLQMQKINNQINTNQKNQNIIQQKSPYMNYNSNLFSKNQMPFYSHTQYGNINYINNLNNQIKENYLRVSNLNKYPFGNNISSMNMNNLNMMDMKRSNNINLPIVNLNNPNLLNICNNKNESYINNINNMILRNKNYQYSQNNLNNKIGVYPKMIENNIFNNIYNSNQNNNNLNNQIVNNFPQYNRKNIPKDGNNINNITNNNIDYNINIGINNNISNNYINQNKIYQKDLKKKNSESDKYVNPADYLENPTLIITKNAEKKNWLVLNNNNSIIHNFNSEELYKFLEEKNKMDKSLEELTINDYDTDVVFPAKVIYENLKIFYSHNS